MAGRRTEQPWLRWSTNDVVKWLVDCVELPQHAERFAAHRIDGPTLLELTQQTLEDPLGVVDPLHRRRILRQVQQLLQTSPEEVHHSNGAALQRP